jgi:hypothetical protein
MILNIFEMYPRCLIMKIPCFEGMGPLSGEMASIHTSSQTPAYFELISTPNMLRNRLPTVLEVQSYRERTPAGEPLEEGEVHYTIKDYPMVLSS